MPTVHDMSIEELRERAAIVRSLCRDTGEVVPVLMARADSDATAGERFDLQVAQERVLDAVRRCFEQIPELLPGLMSPELAHAIDRDETLDDAQLAALREAIDARLPAPRLPDSAITREERVEDELVERAHELFERFDLYAGIYAAIDDLVDELRRALGTMELRMHMPWRPATEDLSGPNLPS